MQRHFKIAAIAAAVLSTFHAHATEGSIAPEVVVTATRFSEKSLEAPVGVQIISSQDIAQSAVSSIGEVLSKLGGMQIRNNTGDTNPQIDLRGFGITGDQNTLILVDGQRISENEQAVARLSSIPLQSIERIEILPGTGAVLYGSGATAGVINIVTRAAGLAGTDGQVSVGIGGFATRSLQVGLNAAQENVGMRLNASQLNSDNDRVNNNVKERTVDGDLHGFFGGNEAYIKFGGSRQELGLPGSLTMAQIAADPHAASTPTDHGTNDGWRVSLGGQVPLSFGEFAADLSYRNRDSESIYAAAGGSTQTVVDAWAFTPRLRIPYQLAGYQNILVTGVDFNYWKLDRNINAPLFFFVSHLLANQKDAAYYFQNSTQLTQATKVTLGARWQTTDIDQADRLVSGSQQSQSNNMHAWELGLRHSLADNLALYGRMGSSFRFANVDDNGFTQTGQMLLPQTSRDREIGIEWGYKKNRLRTSVFDSNLKNEIHFINVPGAFFFNGFNTNLPETRHHGVEIDGAWQASSDLALHGNYRYTSAKFESGTYFGTNVAGNKIPLVPSQRINLQATYRIDEMWMLSGSLQRIGAQYYDNDQSNTFQKMPAYTLADMKLSWQQRDWAVSASVNNLFDREYYSYGIRNNAGTSFNAYPEPGRLLMLNVEYKFH